MIQLSVITVSHNRKDLLLRKLKSLKKQSLGADAFEWILCINGSTDGSKNALESATTPFSSSIFSFDQNRSISEARNACAKKAQGKTLYFSDDDCILQEDTLEQHLKAQAEPCVAIGAIQFEADQSEHWQPKQVSYWNLNGANSSVPKEAFDKVGGFDERIQGYGGEDLLLGYKLHKTALAFKALRTSVTHVGPNPMRGQNLEKAKSAGSNAMKIAKLYPELAYPLGVSPLLMTLKRFGFGPLAALFKRFNPNTFAYEQAYFEGAKQSLEQERKEHG